MKNFDEQMMLRCIQLAKNGLGTTYPNPLVGCVIVHNEKIIAEAWHLKAGKPHAEVNAILQIHDKEILQNSTLYVSLEPCAHHGKTPPCADLIIQNKIPKVVVGTVDPFAKVNGLGIQKMKDAGIEVISGVLENECSELNKRFFTFHQKKRPYVILKWAQTANGFMAAEKDQQKWITNEFSKQLVHKWRTEEQAILVGRKTAEIDNPQLNARLWNGNQPIRFVLDKDLKLNDKLNLFDQSQRTIVFIEKEKSNQENLEFVQIHFDENLTESILSKLYELEIQSVIIEGGKRTLESFIEKDLWDEARIFTSENRWISGIQSPEIKGGLIHSQAVKSDKLEIFKR
ncbi:MAG TPA: bifunctional diaminohydroxyphosphoribosylaminopyrimidine deaminase/5-amino-6-(5-phosphoribosylamino)uracil reductase RibD [Moheibacter sp.]|nr:bifunctional diaminohydroxyphosphoribosylaminopyrimidine deaminase/5-amino-6-(5-phosphoribosylamino)uracil reductase RibD [Moheibacter sp.]